MGVHAKISFPFADGYDSSSFGNSNEDAFMDMGRGHDLMRYPGDY